jgi:hypothetical protein
MSIRCAGLCLLLLAAACSGEQFASEATGGAAGAGGGGGTGGSAGGTGGAVTASSCKELKESGVTQSGLYPLLDKNGVAFSARCEMTVANGGWTLIARSFDTDQDYAFGWRSAAGAADDPTRPYSMNVGAKGLTFSEILLAERDGDYGITKGFVGSVPPGFLKLYAQTPYLLNPPVQTVAGSCPPSGGVSMMSRVGYTSRTDIYFVRDHEVFENFGLTPSGWNLGESNQCDYNADINWKQGMIFVR